MSDVIPMLGMTHQAWQATLSRGLQMHSAEQVWLKQVADKIEATDAPKGLLAARQRTLAALRKAPNTDADLISAVAKMAGMMPSAARGTIGVRGHLLGSISRKYRREADLLWVAIRALVKTQNVT